MEPTKEADAVEAPLKHENKQTTSEQDDDVEKQAVPPGGCIKEDSSLFKGLGILDRFLAVWIILAMAIGIILGNFVPSTGPALQKGTFVGVSIPIGKCKQRRGISVQQVACRLTTFLYSHRSPGYDVPYSLQSAV